MHEQYGASEAEALIAALQNDQPQTSIRVNPLKAKAPEQLVDVPCSPVPWCNDGFHLQERPSFTTNPLFHAGCFYVQEASSMFLTHALRHLPLPAPHPTVLDLCAAPGGKSLSALSALPDALLVSNEINGKRASILCENIQKWGWSNCVVTNNAPKDFQAFPETFDLIITDVPCSGEGMFQKEEQAIEQWSMRFVEQTAALQRSILQDIWTCLKPGGFLIYSTCTFNHLEDEQNVQFITEQLGGRTIELPINSDWNILPGAIPATYHFMPHRVNGYGFFLCTIQKDGEWLPSERKKGKKEGKSRANVGKQPLQLKDWLKNKNDFAFMANDKDQSISAIAEHDKAMVEALQKHLRVKSAGIPLAYEKKGKYIPHPALALSVQLRQEAFPKCELGLEDALTFLRAEALHLPENTPKGYLLVTYQHVPLGFVNNIGTRANNLYPSEWRIRKC